MDKFRCVRCLHVFRDRYNLAKHMSRKAQCEEVFQEGFSPSADFGVKKSSISTQKSSIPTQKSIIPIKKSSISVKKSSISPGEAGSCASENINKNKRCKYCFCVYSTTFYKNKHETICKLKDDPVRLLEIECNVDITFPESKDECRFCNKMFFNIQSLNRHISTCKDRSEYHQNLIEYRENQSKSQVPQTQIINNNNTVNNNTVNNTVNNNLIINIVGNENMDHVNVEQIIDILRKIDKEYDHSHIYLKAGKFITSFDKLLCEKEENRNVIVPNSKSLYSEVMTPTGWVKESVDDSLNRSFKNSAQKLYDTKDSIEEYNDKVFKAERNVKVFTEVKQFANKGFNHYSPSCNPDDKRKVKSGYKIAKLEHDTNH